MDLITKVVIKALNLREDEVTPRIRMRAKGALFGRLYSSSPATEADLINAVKFFASYILLEDNTNA